MENLKLKKNHRLVVAADGSAASGKTTGAKHISKKYGLKFLSSGLLYRYASHQLLIHKPKNKISFLKKSFNNFSLKKLDKINLHTPEISEHTSFIAKQKNIRNILKIFQIQFAQKFKRVCIEGRDIGTVILPKADIKFFFRCSLDVAARRRFKELKKIDSKIKLKDVKKALKIRNYRDKKRKNSPLLKSHDAIIVDTSLRNIKSMINKLSKELEIKLINKYGN